MMCVSISCYAQTKNTIQVFQKNGNVLTSLANDIDSIVYEADDSVNEIIQKIHYSDSTYKMPVATVDSLILCNINIPTDMFFSEGIGEWTELRLANDGTFYIEKNNSDTGFIEKSLLLTMSDEGVFCYPVLYDKSGFPKIIGFNDLSFIVDSCYNDSIDLTIVYKDSIAYYYEGLVFTEISTELSRTRSWSELTPAGRVAAVLQLGAGVIGVVGGYATMVVSVLAEGATLGASTLGVVGGAATAISGAGTYEQAMRKIREPNYNNPSNVGDAARTITLQDAVMRISQWQEQFGGNHVPQNIDRGLNIASLLSFFMEISAEMIEMRYGSAITLDDMRAYYHNRVITFDTEKDEYSTLDPVVVDGYIDPTITVSLRDGTQLDNEYGIVVYSEEVEFREKSIIQNGTGGHIAFNLEKMEPANYYYQAFYYDKTNGISVLGDVKTFEVVGAVKTGDIKNRKSTSVDAYGQILAVDLSIISKSKYEYGICFTDKSSEEDWTFIPSNNLDSGGFFSVSLSNLKPKTKYTYCAYLELGEDDYLYGVEETFETEKKSDETNLCPDDKHPHMIDLGLPSGTKWACCNVGARSPEEFGGYYAWGEVNEKDDYTEETYVNRTFIVDELLNEYWVYDFIGADISGTQYDVAHVRWGGGWCMPTLNQWIELSEYTSNEVLDDYVRYTGTNGKSIVFPFGTGYKALGKYYTQRWPIGYYWASTCSDFIERNGSFPDSAVLWGDIEIRRGRASGIWGFSVRAVCK